MTSAVRVCAAFPGLVRYAKRKDIALEDIPTTVDRMEEEGILPHPEKSGWCREPRYL